MSGIEILGLAASVIQIAELGGKLSVKIFTFTRKVKNANKTIDALSQEIAVTGAVLQQLGETLSSDGSAKVCSQEAIDTAKKLVTDTEKVFRNLENLLDVEDKPNSRFRKAVNLKRLKFPFLESEIEQVQANLERLKSSLLVILNVLIFAEQLRNRETLPILEDQRDLIRTLAAEKDVNEQRYEQILKAISDRPNAQVTDSGVADTSSIHSNTLTLVGTGGDTSQDSLHITKPSISKVVEPPDIKLPSGLKHHYERIHHHTSLVQNLLSEIDSLDYKLDHGIRGRLQTGVLDSHWNEWTSQRKHFGNDPFEKILENSSEIARYWADKTLNEELPIGDKNPVAQPQLTQPKVDQVRSKLAQDHIARLHASALERGEKLEDLVSRGDDLVMHSKAFYRQTKTQPPTWYGIVGAPVGWIGSAFDTVGSLPGKIWGAPEERPFDPTTVPSPIISRPTPTRFRFKHAVEEARYRRKDLKAAANNPKIGKLSANDSRTYIAWRKQMKSPQTTFDCCSRELLEIFRVTFDTFDTRSSNNVPEIHLGDMIRSLGYDLSDEVLVKGLKEAGVRPSDGISFEIYIGFMLKAMDDFKNGHDDDEDDEDDEDDDEEEPAVSETKVPAKAQEASATDLGHAKKRPAVPSPEVVPVAAVPSDSTEPFTSSDQLPVRENKDLQYLPKIPSPFELNTIDEDQLQSLKDVFELFDKNNRGSVETADLQTIMRSLGENVSDEDFEGIAEEMDPEATGSITFEDFLGFMTPLMLCEKHASDDTREAFKVFDRDNKGTISIDEFRALAKLSDDTISDEEIDEMLAEIYTGCGIDYELALSMLSPDLSEANAANGAPSQKGEEYVQGSQSPTLQQTPQQSSSRVPQLEKAFEETAQNFEGKISGSLIPHKVPTGSSQSRNQGILKGMDEGELAALRKMAQEHMRTGYFGREDGEEQLETETGNEKHDSNIPGIPAERREAILRSLGTTFQDRGEGEDLADADDEPETATSATTQHGQNGKGKVKVRSGSSGTSTSMLAESFVKRTQEMERERKKQQEKGKERAGESRSNRVGAEVATGSTINVDDLIMKFTNLGREDLRLGGLTGQA